ncbi:uncharacterized protein LOC131432857 [Malaya genurostris]|uniref:uncharacterized protein LOC131432857 n=1 Tax=Malaya genurostris TaxID=325434 RepID=UPI0026F3DDDC|nr:uncharacterized protein LOC131432857 [Malaya genurostris]
MDVQPEYVRMGLNKVATEQGFTEGKYRIEFEAGSSKGDGFMGSLSKAIIREDGHQDLVLLVKLLPESEIRRHQSILMFHREFLAYDVLIPALEKFQAEKSSSSGKINNGFWRVPKCYYTSCSVEKLEAMVIMEDLRENNFRMWNKYEPVDFEHSRMILEQLGKLHAISFAMKDQQPEMFEQFKTFTDPIKTMIGMDPKKIMDNLFSEMYERAISTLTEKDNEVKESMGHLKGIVMDHYLNCVNAEDAEPYAVIAHGDCWINNMMFTYDEKGSTPTDIRLIDWQLCRYVSPILDLSYFLFICTDEKLRSEHYDELLDIYYRSLSDHLVRLGGDAERQFSRDAFHAQWKKYGRFGLLMGLIVLPMICTASNDLPDMDEYCEKLETETEFVPYEYGTEEKAFELYRKRMSGLIRDTVRLGYL